MKLNISKQDVIDVIKKRWWIILIELVVIAIVIVADLCSKDALYAKLVKCTGMEATGIKNFINLTYVENTGAGFGVFSDNVIVLSIITSIVMVILLIALALCQKENEFLRLSLTFIIGGGIGNLVDRIKFGYVRDFFQFDFWQTFPVFNVADIFVTVGGIMLIIALIIMLVQEAKLSKKKFEEEKSSNSIEEPKSVIEGQDMLDVAQPLNEFLDDKDVDSTKKDE